MLHRARKAISGILLLTLTAGLLPAVEHPADLAALATAQAAHATLQGRFTWTVLRDGESQAREGSFAVARGEGDKPARYHVQMARADGSELQRWCSDGERQWKVERLVADDPTTQDVTEGDDPDLRRVVRCVLLDLTALGTEFTAAYDATAGRLVLTPRTPDLARSLAEIRVSLDGNQPREVVLEDPQQGRITVTLREVVAGQPVDERLFRVR